MPHYGYTCCCVIYRLKRACATNTSGVKQMSATPYT